ncbi:MAG TPA: ATP phosphoribosyltransferase regulatory subunit, partial [Caulobacteraceae bacterium]|nr:ATP phosphoribosyltransferase regulatory subunit [Caulobacteraceae bacterium]
MRLEPAIPAEALAAIRAPFVEAGATPTDAPVLQPLALLLDLAGEAMRSRLFVVQGEGGEEAALRPDFTIPIARVHIEAGAASGSYLYEGKAFRVAPPGSGRAEEFLQVGLEAYGGADPVADDAEVAALAWRAAQAGGRSDLTLELGDVSLFAAFVDSLSLEPPLAARLKRAFSRPRLLKAELEGDTRETDAGQIAALLAGLPEAEAVGVLEELWTLAGIEPVGGRSAADIAHRLVERAETARGARLTSAEADKVRAFLAISDAPDKALDAIARLSPGVTAVLDRWSRRLAAMAERGADPQKMRLSTAFGRAFGYYDGMLFEVRSAALGDDQPVAAGGRYDGLPARLGG